MKQLLASLLLLLFLPLLAGCRETVTNPAMIKEWPAIYPDYVGVTIPATIAPLNFTMKEGGFELLDVFVRGARDGELRVQSSGATSIPQDAWKNLLAGNQGDKLLVTVRVKSDGVWKEYLDFPIYVSSYPIDYGLAYRLIVPGYEISGMMGIYERDLSSFRQRAILEATQVPGICVNCHSFNQCNPKDINLHLRCSSLLTILRQAGSTRLIDSKTEATIGRFSYPYWHPGGRYIAYSLNNTRQAHHVEKEHRIEVFDLSSDVIVYDTQANEILKSDLLTTDKLETTPAFSPDGKTLYFCVAEPHDVWTNWKELQYNLCSIAFDPATGTFGNKVETLLDAAAMKKSVAFPRPSFDGGNILLTLVNYGNFTIWHTEADLWLLDLRDKTYRPLKEVNSDRAEGYHNWSSNSHWFVFASRRDDGLYTRLYLASVDEIGTVGKPFMLPQENPFVYYDELLYSYNVPEFVTEPVPLDGREIETHVSSTQPVQAKVRQVK